MRLLVILTLCIAIGVMLSSHADWHLLAVQGAVIVGVSVCMAAILRSEDAVEIARLRSGDSEHDRRDDDDDNKPGPSPPSDGAAEAV